MSEEEIKAALSLEVEIGGYMSDVWREVKLMWNDEVISEIRIPIEND